jgi:ABC-type multidrug transport system permease subunit
MKAFVAVVRGQFLIFVRNRLDFFLTMGFPLVLVFLFGFIWAAPEGSVKLGAVFNGPREPVLQALANFPELSVQEFAGVNELEQSLARHFVDFGIVWDGNSLVFLFDRGRIQDNPTFEGYARRITRALELEVAGATAPIRVEKVHVGKLSTATWFYYIVPGLMVLALVQAGVFAVAGRLAGMRELGVLRRLLVSPISSWALVFGVGVVRMTVGFFSAGLTALLACAVFQMRFMVSPGPLLFYALASALGAMGLGAVVSMVARKPGSAAAAGMILVQVLLFLSGIYIPLEFLPSGLRLVAKILPAYYLAQGMRAAMGVIEGVPANFWAGLGFSAFGLLALLLFGRSLISPR